MNLTSVIVQSSGFKIQDSGFRVQSSGLRVQGSGCRVQGSGFRVQGRVHNRTRPSGRLNHKSEIDRFGHSVRTDSM